MSSQQDMSLRRFLMETKDKADAVLNEQHTGADAKIVITQLLQISSGLIDLIDSTMGQSADARVIKRRMEQQRSENTKIETKMSATKNAVIQLATQVEVIAVESKNIRSRTALANDPNAASATRIDSAVTAIVKAITELSSL